MKIGVISDTHLTDQGTSSNTGLARMLEKVRGGRPPLDLLELVAPHFEGVDAILHAGDMVDLSVFKVLESIAPVMAVSGNMDGPDVTLVVPSRRIETIGKFKIGLIHGSGSPFGLEEKLRPEFGEVDCIVYGHTHIPCNEVRDGVLFFNPGSPTDRAFAPYNALGILTLDETIRGEIIRL